MVSTQSEGPSLTSCLTQACHHAHAHFDFHSVPRTRRSSQENTCCEQGSSIPFGGPRKKETNKLSHWTNHVAQWGGELVIIGQGSWVSHTLLCSLSYPHEPSHKCGKGKNKTDEANLWIPCHFDLTIILSSTVINIVIRGENWEKTRPIKPLIIVRSSQIRSCILHVPLKQTSIWWNPGAARSGCRSWVYTSGGHQKWQGWCPARTSLKSWCVTLGRHV